VTFEQFELPLIIGLPAKVNIFAFRIYTELNPASGLPDYGAACAISLPFLLLGVMSLLLYNRATRRAERFVTVTGKATAQRRLTLGAWKLPALALLCVYVAIAALLPLLTLVWTSLFGYAGPGRVSLAEAHVLPYRQFLTDPTVWRALGNTLVVATLSALLVTGLGGLIAWIVARSTMPGRRLLDVLSFMSLGIPAVIAGLAVMVLYLSLPIGIYGTIWILVIAYSYRLATTTRLAKSGLMQIHRELEEAAQMSGARWLATQLRILIPLLTPALSSAFLVAFIIALREFTIPFILYSSENLVLPVLVWQLFQNGEPARSAALGVLMIVVILPGILALRLFLVRDR
jgi:iron(III) transport system permease protein